MSVIRTYFAALSGTDSGSYAAQIAKLDVATGDVTQCKELAKELKVGIVASKTLAAAADHRAGRALDEVKAY